MSSFSYIVHRTLIWLRRCYLLIRTQRSILKWYGSTIFLEQLSSSTNKLVTTLTLGYSRKNPNRGGLGYTFLKSPPGNFTFVTLSQEIPEKKSFYRWKFCKFVWHPLEIPKSKTKTHENSALVFLENPWNFHFFFNWPLEFPHDFSSRPPEIPCPQSPVWIFAGIAN